MQANASVRGNRESSSGSGAEFCDEFSDVSAVAAEALGGVDAETVLHREFDALFSASRRDRNDETETEHCCKKLCFASMLMAKGSVQF